MEQSLFPGMPACAEPVAAGPTRPEDARVVGPVRNQIELVPRDLESSLPDNHPARAIWAFLEQMDLSDFYARIKAVIDSPGRPASDPRVLLALWVLATVDGVGSARRLARLCQEHDAYRWMCGRVPVNYHLLADFRVGHQQALDELLTRIVATMMAARLVRLERVAHDGMRVRASAGASSFRSKSRLERCLAAAREQVQQLAEQREHPDSAVSQRERAARERAAREQEARIEQALRQLPKLEAAKQRQRRTLGKPRRAQVTEPRASTTDPDARVMKMADGGFRPALNVQLATDAASRVIVGVSVTAQGTDAGQAVPMEQQLAERTGQHPAEYLMDGGLATRRDITTLERQGIRVYAPARPPRTTTSGRQRATPRPDDTPEVAAWRRRMETEPAKAIYKQRAATAEWVNAQLRERHQIRQFRVRGLAKATTVLLLVAVTHNLLRWIALTS